MKRKNVKDDILRYILSFDVPRVERSELLKAIGYDSTVIDFAILQLEKEKYLVVVVSDEEIHYQLTQNGEIFITNTSYLKEHRKSNTSIAFQAADKLIAISGILFGIVFGINSYSTDNHNDRLLEIIEKKDRTINVQYSCNVNQENLQARIDSLSKKLDALQLRQTTNETKSKK